MIDQTGPKWAEREGLRRAACGNLWRFSCLGQHVLLLAPYKVPADLSKTTLWGQ